MSARLREALRAMKKAREDARGAPVVYLHDPNDGKMFAALVDLAILESPEAFAAWDPMSHDHLEGDEDEL